MVRLLAFLFVVGCASTNHDLMDKRTHPYIKRFERLYGKKVGPVSIYFRRFPKYPNAAGVCRILDQEIYLNVDFWNKKNAYEREMLVFHELGHCELGTGHDYQEPIDYTCFKSIMNYMSMPGHCYKNKLKYYRNELFKRKRSHRWRILKSRRRLGY